MKKGFTLIELLVVVVIIGILSAIALPQYQKSILKSRYVQAKLLATSLARAQQAFFQDNDAYATNLSDLPIDIPLSRSGEKCMGSTCNFTWGRVWLDDGKVVALLWDNKTQTDLVAYILPLDGSKPSCYVYESSAKKDYHQLCATETGQAIKTGHTYDYP